MTTSIVERLRDKSLVIQHPERDQIADLIEQQAKEIAELKRLLAEEQEISSDGLLIAHLNGAASARDRIRKLEVLAKKMADALETIRDKNRLSAIGIPTNETHAIAFDALSTYRELIKE